MNNLLERTARAIWIADGENPDLFKDKRLKELYGEDISVRHANAFKRGQAAITAICDEIDEGAGRVAYQAAADEVSRISKVAPNGHEERYPHWPVIEKAIKAYLAHLKSTTDIKGAV